MWERRKVDFALLVSRRRARATRESSRGRKWPIPRPQRVHALHWAALDAREVEDEDELPMDWDAICVL